MKEITLFCGFLVAWLLLAGTVFGQGDIKKQPSCHLCGMDRQGYTNSRMVVAQAEGEEYLQPPLHRRRYDR